MLSKILTTLKTLCLGGRRAKDEGMHNYFSVIFYITVITLELKQKLLIIFNMILEAKSSGRSLDTKTVQMFRNKICHIMVMLLWLY